MIIDVPYAMMDTIWILLLIIAMFVHILNVLHAMEMRIAPHAMQVATDIDANLLVHTAAKIVSVTRNLAPAQMAALLSIISNKMVLAASVLYDVHNVLTLSHVPIVAV